jgi:hypothetical protein
LILIQEQHGTQVPQPLVGESVGRQQFQAFDLTKVGSFPKGEKIE